MISLNGLSPHARTAFEAWINEGVYTHLVTLTTNKEFLSPQRMRDRLRRWDAHVNRRLYGPKWKQRPDERLWFFAFLEKPEANPHWHLLLRLYAHGDVPIADTAANFKNAADLYWTQLSPQGTVHIVQLANRPHERLTNYLAKELKREIQYQAFITPDEFRV